MKMKIDTGADRCILKTDDLQILPISIDLRPSDSILKGNGGSRIENLGVTTLKVTYGNKSVETKFHVVKAPGNPFIIGCKQAQDLGITAENPLTSLTLLRPQKGNNLQTTVNCQNQSFKKTSKTA